MPLAGEYYHVTINARFSRLFFWNRGEKPDENTKNIATHPAIWVGLFSAPSCSVWFRNLRLCLNSDSRGAWDFDKFTAMRAF